MKILHLYSDGNPLIAKHVNMLEEQDEANGKNPDIVHVHGCWQYKVVREAMRLHCEGVRIVFSPHGGLMPWIIGERRLSEKLSKTILWQRRMTEYAYVVIARGKMEADALQELGWNPRVEIIRDAVITNSITPEAMYQQAQEVYRKVMDSNTLALMGHDTQRLLSLLLKAGITGDSRWVTEEPPAVDEREWRRLLIYADHENVRTTVDKGVRVLGIHHPYIETAQIKSYLPTNYQQPKAEAHDVAGLAGEIHRRGLTLRHLVELDRALRRDDVDDSRLTDGLDESHLLKYFRRLLQLLTEQTLLDEGYWPAPPLNDRKTQSMRNELNNHLRI